MNKENVVIIFRARKKKIVTELEIPIGISATELVMGLNEAYDLGIDISNIRECYLISYNPIALIKGDKTIKEFGIRDGSTVLFNN